MIEMLGPLAGRSHAQLVLHPPRALGARQFVLLFAALAGLMGFSAGLGWLSGNVFAPAFALLHCFLVGAALRASWRNGERREEIRVGPDCVEVIPAAGGSPVFRAHPYWVRLMAGEERVLLVSSGKRVEVGSFLAPAERRELAAALESLLAAGNGCKPTTSRV
ncbi:DUF2244 domain-containing protein [Stenotrophomonas mori]|uniref:DUF2244 domain-containing protein n=1 Tax=Stenotrophomonas mori TaxID=2871096 RepID=A0ABT0SKB6_9GAMM|nr:DUF2244 domain-containing protein [Stenotrophomonas mori]MCL7715528.1 DUF2244 domain-containing protein [Stenotrophomonas mori]